MNPSLAFWYDFASTYSYPAAMRIESIAERAGVAIVWRPFLLGPIFSEQGWNDSPFNLYDAKGRYMWRDMARICEAATVPFVRPDPFPARSLLAARTAIALATDREIGAFSRDVFSAQFGDGRDIADPVVLSALLNGRGMDGSATIRRAGEQRIKAALRSQTKIAEETGIFGAPAFVCPDGELFWGNDRLEDAVAWAALHHNG